MLYFPQLATGALAQYPVRKRRHSRTVLNNLADGSDRKLLDAPETVVSWQFAFAGLTADERSKLEQFFEEVEGKLGAFTFLDPTDNLLLWSEQLTNSAWAREPLLVLTEGVPDPLGTSRATRIHNAGATAQTIEQAIEGPGWYHYCFSLYARSTQPTGVMVVRSTASSNDSVTYTAGLAWTRLAHSGKFESTDEGVTFGLRLEGGAIVEVFGAQAECQPAASEYKRTTSRSGIYENTRFDDDVLTVTADDLNAHSCLVRIAAVLPQ